MEESTREFLVRIINTLSLVLIWMMVQMTWGIYMGWAFTENQSTWHNAVYYLFFFVSLFALLRHLKRKWKR